MDNYMDYELDFDITRKMREFAMTTGRNNLLLFLQHSLAVLFTVL